MSFCALGKELLGEGYQFLLTEKFLCQDPLEQYFAKQRAATGSNNNPSMSQVVGYNRLHAVCQSVEVDLGGNCSKKNTKVVINSEPLKKRPKKK